MTGLMRDDGATLIGQLLKKINQSTSLSLKGFAPRLAPNLLHRKSDARAVQDNCAPGNMRMLRCIHQNIFLQVYSKIALIPS